MERSEIDKLKAENERLISQNNWLRNELKQTESWLDESDKKLTETESQLKFLWNDYKLTLYSFDKFKHDLQTANDSLINSKLDMLRDKNNFHPD